MMVMIRCIYGVSTHDSRNFCVSLVRHGSAPRVCEMLGNRRYEGADGSRELRNQGGGRPTEIRQSRRIAASNQSIRVAAYSSFSALRAHRRRHDKLRIPAVSALASLQPGVSRVQSVACHQPHEGKYK